MTVISDRDATLGFFAETIKQLLLSMKDVNASVNRSKLNPSPLVHSFGYRTRRRRLFTRNKTHRNTEKDILLTMSSGFLMAVVLAVDIRLSRYGV